MAKKPDIVEGVAGEDVTVAIGPSAAVSFKVAKALKEALN